eukprot:1158756-Pelagomonas_calceolata.AAC.17
MSGWPCAGMPAVPPPGIELKGMSARKDAQRDERTVYRQSTDRGDRDGLAVLVHTLIANCWLPAAALGEQKPADELKSAERGGGELRPLNSLSFHAPSTDAPQLAALNLASVVLEFGAY